MSFSDRPCQTETVWGGGLLGRGDHPSPHKCCLYLQEQAARAYHPVHMSSVIAERIKNRADQISQKTGENLIRYRFLLITEVAEKNPECKCAVCTIQQVPMQQRSKNLIIPDTDGRCWPHRDHTIFTVLVKKRRRKRTEIMSDLHVEQTSDHEISQLIKSP